MNWNKWKACWIEWSRIHFWLWNMNKRHVQDFCMFSDLNLVGNVKLRDCFSVSFLSLTLQSDTEFWDKMQAELEELARRNWLEDLESKGKNPANISPNETVRSANWYEQLYAACIVPSEGAVGQQDRSCHVTWCLQTCTVSPAGMQDSRHYTVCVGGGKQTDKQTKARACHVMSCQVHVFNAFLCQQNETQRIQNCIIISKVIDCRCQLMLPLI